MTHDGYLDALHEAGHAIVGKAVGHFVSRIHIGEDGCYCDGWHYGEDPRDVRLRALVSLGGYLAAAMYGQGMGYDVNDWATAEDDWQAFQDRRDGMTYRHARRKVQAILRANEAQLLSLTARVQRERDVALDPTPEQVAIAMVEVPLWTP